MQTTKQRHLGGGRGKYAEYGEAVLVAQKGELELYNVYRPSGALHHKEILKNGEEVAYWSQFRRGHPYAPLTTYKSQEWDRFYKEVMTE